LGSLAATKGDDVIKVWRRNWTSQARRIAEADALVVSIPKSGRTWLRVFLHDYFCRLEGRECTLDPDELAGSRVPKFVFTHDLWEHIKAQKLEHRIKGKYLIPARASRTKPIVLLARDPRDVIVSLFFQRTKRSSRYDGDLSEMIRHPYFGIDSVIDVMNTWIAEWSGRSAFKLLRYEDCRRNTDEAFRELLAFLGIQSIDEAFFARSLQFSSFENMKQLEATGRFRTRVLQPGNVNDTESFKVRRGVVGGYRDYLTPEDIVYLNAAVARLDPRYGYQGEREIIGSERGRSIFSPDDGS
jgi:hypothetical protein